MKHIIKFFNVLAAALIAIAFTSCETDLPIFNLSTDPADYVVPVFENPAEKTVILDFNAAEDEFELFKWTAAEYGVSVPVNYSVQVDATDAFTSPTTVGSETSVTQLSTTVGTINSMALAKGLLPFEEGTLSFRVAANVAGTDDIETIYSPIIHRTVTPYVTEFASIWIVGSNVGWNWGNAIEVYGVAPFEYSVIAEFQENQDFRFFEEYNNWDLSYNFPFFDGGTIDPSFENAFDGDENFHFTGATGYYRITLNTSTKAVSMEFLPNGKPTLFLVGNAVPEAGWGWDTPVELTWIKDGLFEGVTDFVSGAGNAFRFFTIEGDWGSGRNYPYYVAEEYDIDPLFSDAGDGDNNFQFNGEDGPWKIIVNDIDKTIVMASEGTAGPPLWMVGGGLPAAGWGWDTPVEIVQREPGIFIADTEFANDAFRVFDINGDWNSGRNYPSFIDDGYTIDPVFEDAMDGDNNFLFTGTPGNYRFTLDENAKTITLTDIPMGDSKWLVGAGVPAAGWGWDTPIELIQFESGKWRGTTEFANDAFRVFDISGDWNSGTNYPGFIADGYTIDADFEDALDGDNNFSFIGTPGTYTFTIDDNAKTITLD